MDYSDDYLRSVLPERDPPSDRVPAEVEREIEGWRGPHEGEPAVRSARWTYAVFEEIRALQYRIDGLPVALSAARMSVGLLDPKYEKSAFGIIIDVPKGLGGHLGRVDFPRLDQGFDLWGRSLPITTHAPIHPVGATSAAWACANATAAWGVITAGHAVAGHRAGTPVSLANGSRGALLKSYHPPIDAAFVGLAAAAAPPPGLTALALRSFPAAGQAMDVHAQSGAVGRAVVSVTDTRGVINTRYMPIIVFLDLPLQPGDSGSLVTGSNGDAVAIYTAEMTDGSGQQIGLAQHFEQAMLALDATAFA